MKMRAAELGSLVLFVALVLGGGLIIGFATAPGAWYAALSKPPFSPPNWIFAPVWSTLYIIIAIAGWRVWSIVIVSDKMQRGYRYVLSAPKRRITSLARLSSATMSLRISVILPNSGFLRPIIFRAACA